MNEFSFSSAHIYRTQIYTENGARVRRCFGHFFLPHGVSSLPAPFVCEMLVGHADALPRNLQRVRFRLGGASLPRGHTVADGTSATPPNINIVAYL
jgi:hypothetical protein